MRIDSTLGARSQSTNSQLSAWFRHSFDADARDTPAPGQPASLDATDAECPGVQKRLRIWTFGLRTLDGFEFRGLGVTAQIEELKAALQRNGVENVDLVFNVRTFHDPDRRWNRHIGVHPEILHRMTTSPKFKDFLRHVRRKVLLAFRSKQELRVAFFCNKGRNRSVAASRLLKHIGTMEGWDVACDDLCAQAWHNTCKGECQACCEENDNEKRRLALLRAWQQWR